jgi:copper chaperone
MTEKTYTVVGMTCDHCALSVREKVSAIEGVETVDVDLAAGQLRVRTRNASDTAIADAVADAGYQVAA